MSTPIDPQHCKRLRITIEVDTSEWEWDDYLDKKSAEWNIKKDIQGRLPSILGAGIRDILNVTATLSEE